MTVMRPSDFVKQHPRQWRACPLPSPNTSGDKSKTRKTASSKGLSHQSRARTLPRIGRLCPGEWSHFSLPKQAPWDHLCKTSPPASTHCFSLCPGPLPCWTFPRLLCAPLPHLQANAQAVRQSCRCLCISQDLEGAWYTIKASTRNG